MRSAKVHWCRLAVCTAGALYTLCANGQEPAGASTTEVSTESVETTVETEAPRTRLWDRLQLRVGGHVMLDWADIGQSSGLDEISGEPGGGGAVRDTQFDIRGVLFNKTSFRLQLDLVDGEFELQDNYITREDVPYLGRVRIGHFNEPFGLENTMSLRSSPFLERSLVDGIAPSRGLGIEFANTGLGERITWAVGTFYGTQSVDKISESDSLSLTGRITGLPLYDEEREQLLHVGVSLSHRQLRVPVDYQVRPEVYEAPRYLDTGEFSADALNLIGVEAAYQQRSWLAQAEVMWASTSGAIRQEDATLNDVADEIASRVPRLADWLTGKTGWERPSDSLLWNIPFDLAAREDLAFFGAYGQVSYVLTGERREYDTTRGFFGPVVPARPVRLHGGGWGAWELAARVSHLDLNDEYVKGGRETNFTLGCNWYLTRELRMSLNYVHADVSRDVYEGDMDAVVMRLQIDIKPESVRSRRAGTTGKANW